MQKSDLIYTIETAVSILLTTEQEAVRGIMRDAIRAELKHHDLTRLWCPKFKVYLTKDGIGFDTINVSRDTKCKCGVGYKDARLLYIYHADTEQESHIYGCRCGEIFKVMWCTQ
jgi:hypothetical protein